MHHHQKWFLLVALLLINAATVVTLAKVSILPSRQASQAPSGPASRDTTGTFREYPLPQSDSQIMRLTTDSRGRIWFGEMGHNFLTVFDPQTTQFQQQVPPHGRYGIMATLAAPDDTIWFAEQNANYLGHYFPTTGHYQIYPLLWLQRADPAHAGKLQTLPSAPNELALDRQGQVWCTELYADSLGRLDPRTGRFQHYPLDATRSIQKWYPYGITVAPDGMIWFTQMSSNRLGRLDPLTGRMRFFTMPGPSHPLMEIASDEEGHIWATTFSSGLLVRFDPATTTFTSYQAPLTGPGTSGLYGLIVSPTGEIWVTIFTENRLARLDQTTRRFAPYPLPTRAGEPAALTMDAHHNLWFAELDAIGVLYL